MMEAKSTRKMTNGVSITKSMDILLESARLSSIKLARCKASGTCKKGPGMGIAHGLAKKKKKTRKNKNFILSLKQLSSAPLSKVAIWEANTRRMNILKLKTNNLIALKSYVR